MYLASIGFIFAMLPVILALFLLSPPAFRPGLLLAASLVFYLFVQPEALMAMLVCVALDFAALAVMERFDDNARVRLGCLIFSVAKNVMLLVWDGVAASPGSLVDSVLGVQAYTLCAAGCVLEAYRREVHCERDPVRFALYCCFFPRLYAGPLTSYRQIAPQFKALEPDIRGLGRGLGIFALGAVRFNVLGLSLQTLYESLYAFPKADATVASAWCTALVLALLIYYRFYGLSEMARGVGRMFGVQLPRNFYYPYQSRSVGDFLERFNMTLWRFLNHALPTGGKESPASPLAACFAMLSAGMLMGLWFGLRAGCVFWGAYLAMFALMERRLYPQAMETVPVLFSRGYSLCVVLTGFSFFGADSLGEGMESLLLMLGYNSTELINDRLIYLMSSNWLLLTVSLVCATSIVDLPLSFLRRRLPATLDAILSAAGGLIMLALLVVFSV